MTNQVKRVEGYNHLYRNESGNIVNRDEAGYQAYVKKKISAKLSKEKMDNLSTELIDAKNEIEELKELVRKALEAKQICKDYQKSYGCLRIKHNY